MSETEAQVQQTEQPEKKYLTPEQQMARQIRKMPNTQLANRVRRLKHRQDKMSNIDAAWVIILSALVENTKSMDQGGKLSPYLR